ncbi:MAG: hypothetical protein ACXVDK_17590 [Bacteroidia bacterium]
MYKQHLLQNLERETILLKQLASVIEEKDLQFRPHEKLRSTYELMQYISAVAYVMMRRFVDNDITPEEREKITQHRSTLTRENFEARIDEQWQQIQLYMSKISDQDLLTKEVELPWKEKMPLGAAIINAPVKWLAVYRMELFMYLKMNGHTEMSTNEAWLPKELKV